MRSVFSIQIEIMKHGCAHVYALEYPLAIVQYRRTIGRTERKRGYEGRREWEKYGKYGKDSGAGSRSGGFAGDTGFNVHTVWVRSACGTSDLKGI